MLLLMVTYALSVLVVVVILEKGENSMHTTGGDSVIPSVAAQSWNIVVRSEGRALGAKIIPALDILVKLLALASLIGHTTNLFDDIMI